MVPSSWNWTAFMPPGNGRHLDDIVSHRTQPLARRLGNRRLDLERVALGPEPGRLDRLLQTHAVIDQVDQRLDRARKDPLSAGQAQRVDELAIAQRHHGRHRGGDTFSRRQRQRVAGTRIEQVHIVVRNRAKARSQDFRPEQIVDGLRGRDHVAKTVRDRDVRGVRAFELADGCLPLLRAGRIDRVAPFMRVILRGQPLHRNGDVIGIAARGRAVGERDLHHLGQQMDGLRRAEAEGLDVKPFEDVQHLGDMHAGGRGRCGPRMAQPR